MGNITMSKKERTQLIIFEKLKNDEITQIEAALRLNITDRWVRTKFKRYIEYGAQGLVHKSRGKASTQKWSLDERAIMVGLLKSDWHGFRPKFTSEKLQERENITVCRETVRQAMIAEGLWEKRKSRAKHRKRRERRAMLGLLVQVDGSPHDWFEGRGPRCTLLVFIDDATSKILWLEFATSESYAAVMKATKNYISSCGRPHGFYVDFGSVFSVNLNNKERTKITQWERAAAELDIKVIHAHSPQAKGRVERCNQTLQDRLVKEMRLHGISSPEAANEFIQNGSYISQTNKLFAESPEIGGDAHRPSEFYDLEATFSIIEKRRLANDYTIEHNKRIYQLDNQQPTIIRPRDEITVRTGLDGKVTLSIRKALLVFYEINKRAQKIYPEKIVNNKPHKSGANSRRWASGLMPIYAKP